MTLKELNFRELIKLDVEDPNNYSFQQYEELGCSHPEITGFCTLCEENKFNVCPWDDNFRLLNISHGSHTTDFIDSFHQNVDCSGWYSDGVMFVMESPSRDYKIYSNVSVTKNDQDYEKRPARQWYWIHNKSDMCSYPMYFKGGEYGRFVASAIVTFRLANAYITNLIKCGLNDETGEAFRGIDYYDPKCINNCFNHYLCREIDIIKPKVIFTFGTKVYNYLCNQITNDDIKVVGLPHPAGQRRGFKNEYYNVLYFCMIAKWLKNTGVIDEDFYIEKMLEFANE